MSSEVVKVTLNDRSKPVTITLKADTPPNVCLTHEFAYNRDYFKISGCPSPHDALKDAGFSDKEIEAAWIAFKKYAEKCVTTTSINLTEDCNLNYNIKNGYVAIGTDEKLIVVRNDNIDAQELVDNGFKWNDSLVVPFSEREAYYDKTTDTLMTWW